MTFENKSTAHAVSSSMSGRAEQISKAVSAVSLPETGRFVKGGDGPTERERAELITLVGTLTANQTAEVIRRAMRQGLLEGIRSKL